MLKRVRVMHREAAALLVVIGMLKEQDLRKERGCHPFSNQAGHIVI
jgi:hypothetical protein